MVSATINGNMMKLIFYIVEEIFRICQIKFDDSPPVLRMMDKDPSSKQSLEVASRCLMTCLDSHSSCMPAECKNPPRRLIDVGNESRNPRLVEASLDLQHVKWLALSYCWGGEPSMKLTDETMDKLKSGISLEELDPTIQDAIYVTRALGIPYIWIDALCILQNGKEWSEEASTMNEIYGGSTVTLVIASSKSVKEGFLKVRKLNYIPVAYSTDQTQNRTAKLFLSPEWDDSEHEDNEPWSKRGWTMQEGLLPSRLLHYTASQLVWKCCEEQVSERGVTERVEDEIAKVLSYSDRSDIAFGSGFLGKLPMFLRFKRFEHYLPANPDYPLELQSEVYSLWYDLIEKYTRREFKDISDRLIAISGLARIYGNLIRNVTFVAGLWKEDIIRGLLWYIEDATLVPDCTINNTPALDNVFPSWSWASVGYKVIKNDLKTSDGFSTLSTIEDIQIDLFDPRDPFGAVKDGYIKINGRLKKFKRLYNKEWSSSEVSMTKLERHISQIVHKESHGCVPKNYFSPPGGHFSVLMMLHDGISLYFLVLEATGDVRHNINVYRRAGILKLRHLSLSRPAGPELVTVLEKFNTSLAAKLGQRSPLGDRLALSNDVFEEVMRGNWAKQTVIII